MPEVIDADGHIVDRDSDLRAHLAPPYAQRRGDLLPSDGMDTSMGGLLGGMESNDLATRLRDMDREGVDLSVLFPTGSCNISPSVEPDNAVAHARRSTA